MALAFLKGIIDTYFDVEPAALCDKSRKCLSRLSHRGGHRDEWQTALEFINKFHVRLPSNALQLLVELAVEVCTPRM